MGFIDTLENQKFLPVFYNVEHAVGKGCPNIRDDVKLVQYLLIAFYDKGAPARGWQKPPGQLTVTGFCGPTTMSWILHFQRNCYKDFGGDASLDNRVDRVRNGKIRGTISSKVYTLLWLNKGVATYNQDAFILTPQVVPLENPVNVSPPSNDMISELPREMPAPYSNTGGA
jgi:hypothetical protein